MKLLFNKISFVVLCAMFVPCAVITKEVTSEYLIEVGKIDIGKVFWSITMDEYNYKIMVKLNDKGIFSGLYRFNGIYSAEGRVVNNELEPLNYKQKWVTKEKKKNVGLYFTSGRISKLDLFPAEGAPPKIKYLGIDNVVDPLSSFLKILINNNSSKTVDGRRFYTMAVKQENLQNNIILKNIVIEDYKNIWAEHNKNDLSSIQFEQVGGGNGVVLPHKIKIKYKRLVFNLKKI